MILISYYVLGSSFKYSIILLGEKKADLNFITSYHILFLKNQVPRVGNRRKQVRYVRPHQLKRLNLHVQDLADA